MSDRQTLKIGYLWQYESADMDKIAATVLHIKAVTNTLRERGHHVRLITFRNRTIAWTDDGTTWETATPYQPSPTFRLGERLIRGVQGRLKLPFWRLFDSYHFAQTCKPLLQGYDVLYERFWLLASGGRQLASQLNAPLLYEVNGDIVSEYTQLNRKLSKVQWGIIHRVTRWMFRRTTVITVSEQLQETVASRWQAPNVHTVPNGAHVGLFSTTKPTQQPTHPTVIFVGSFKPWHGLDLLIEAFRLVCEKDGKVRLCLVGDGPGREPLQSLITQYNLTDRVHFAGLLTLPEVAQQLSRANIAILNPRVTPASSAQSPLKLFEYMAAGKAIIAPDTPTYSRLLQDGQTALLVLPNDAQELSGAILQLISDKDLQQRLGIAAQKVALAQHGWAQTVAKLEEIMLSRIIM